MYVFYLKLNSFLLYIFAGRNAERLGVQLYDARESFGTIADKHAEAMVVSLFVNLSKRHLILIERIGLLLIIIILFYFNNIMFTDVS